MLTEIQEAERQALCGDRTATNYVVDALRRYRAAVTKVLAARGLCCTENIYLQQLENETNLAEWIGGEPPE